MCIHAYANPALIPDPQTLNPQHIHDTCVYTHTCTQIYSGSRAPRTSLLASTVAPASSSARTVSVCPFRAEIQRGVLPSCRTGGVRGESCRGGQGAHAYMHAHGCVPGCVCVNQYMHFHAHIPPHVHTVCTCVCVYTRTRVYVYTHTSVYSRHKP